LNLEFTSGRKHEVAKQTIAKQRQVEILMFRILPFLFSDLRYFVYLDASMLYVAFMVEKVLYTHRSQGENTRPYLSVYMLMRGF
jgi:hypothetical protein